MVSLLCLTASFAGQGADNKSFPEKSGEDQPRSTGSRSGEAQSGCRLPRPRAKGVWGAGNLFIVPTAG